MEYFIFSWGLLASLSLKHLVTLPQQPNYSRKKLAIKGAPSDWMNTYYRCVSCSVEATIIIHVQARSTEAVQLPILFWVYHFGFGWSLSLPLTCVIESLLLDLVLFLSWSSDYMFFANLPIMFLYLSAYILRRVLLKAFIETKLVHKFCYK